MTAIEEWRVVPSIPQIEASSWGRIKKLPYTSRQGKQIEGGPTYGQIRRSKKTAKHVYYGVRFRDTGNIKIHRAICEAFHGPSPEGCPYVLHRDGNALNNVPSNLKWGTQKENLQHITFIEYCRSRTGENNPAVKGRKKLII